MVTPVDLLVGGIGWALVVATFFWLVPYCIRVFAITWMHNIRDDFYHLTWTEYPWAREDPDIRKIETFLTVCLGVARNLGYGHVWLVWLVTIVSLRSLANTVESSPGHTILDAETPTRRRQKNEILNTALKLIRPFYLYVAFGGRFAWFVGIPVVLLTLPVIYRQTCDVTSRSVPKVVEGLAAAAEQQLRVPSLSDRLRDVVNGRKLLWSTP